VFLGKSQEGLQLGDSVNSLQGFARSEDIIFKSTHSRYAAMTTPPQPSRAVDGVNTNLTLGSTLTNSNYFLVLAQTPIDPNPN